MNKELDKLCDNLYDLGYVEGQIELIKEIFKLYDNGMPFYNIMYYKANELKVKKEELVKKSKEKN